MSKFKKVLALTIIGSFYATAALAGSGQASNVSISYYDTYATGNTVPMYGDVIVSGYVNPTYSDNSCWYELRKGSSIWNQVQGAVGANGVLATFKAAPTADYHLDLNPDGPNYDGCVATGKAQN